MKLFLECIAFVYGLITKLRNLLFDKGIFRVYRSPIPVVSVGNITAGGSGKTPLVLYLVRYLKARGRSPVVLSRGYGGTKSGPLLIDPSQESAKTVGDESFMLSLLREFPVVAARNRVKGAKIIEDQKLGDIIVLDDGLQHRWLSRSVNIISIDVSSDHVCKSFLADKLLPEGRLREDKESALYRADLLVLNFRGPRRSSVVLSTLRESLPHLPIVEAVAEISSIKPIIADDFTDYDITSSGTKVWLLAAIANPEGFRETVKAAGFAIQGESFFKDHYQFTKKDIEQARRAAGKLAIFCTEKDAVKLSDLGRYGIFVVKIDVAVSEPYVLDALLGSL